MVPSGTFSSRQPFSPKTVGEIPKEGCVLSWKARSRLAFHGRAIAAGGSVAWRARSCCSGRAGAGTRPRAPTARSRGTATLGAASPLLRGLAAPHYPAAGHLPAGTGTPRRLRRAPEETRAAERGASAPRAPGRERAGESWREPARGCTSRRSFPFESSGVQLKLRELENLQTSKEKPSGMHTNSRHLFQESSKFLCVIVEGR